MYVELLVTFGGQRHGVLRMTGDAVGVACDELTRRIDEVLALGCDSLEIDLADATTVDEGLLRELAERRDRLLLTGRTLVVREPAQRIGRPPVTATLAPEM